jgi:hypothetical protein
MGKTLEELEVGDKVTISRIGPGFTIGVVTRLTKTQIEVGKAKYSRKHGAMVGEFGLYRNYIRPATEKDILAAELGALRNKVKATFEATVSNLDTERLRKILELLTGN